MIKKFELYNIDNEIEYMFSELNESIMDFKERIISMVIKLDKLDIDEYAERFVKKLFKFISTKSASFKRIAIRTLFITMVFNSSYDIRVLDNIIDNDIETSVIVKSDDKIKKILEDIRVYMIFKEYEKRADVYLSKPRWSKSVITGKILSDGAKIAYKKYGVLTPVELALAQAQFESHFGTTGLSANNNPFNVGEFDEFTHLTFNSTQEGVNAYFKLMAKDYLNDKNVTELLNNFVNKNGDRYASNEDYENVLRKQVSHNKSYINKRLKS